MAIAHESTVTITRPSNTTEYTAGDVIGIADAGTPANAGSAIHVLSGVASTDRYVILQELQLLVHVATVPAGMAGFRVHFYSESPTAILDNAAYDLVANDRAKWLGSVDLPTPVDRGSTLVTGVTYPGSVFKLAVDNTLYVQLQTLGTFTPSSGAVKTLRARFMEAGI
jgi:hypothetical protein